MIETTSRTLQLAPRRRSVAYALGGMIATGHPLASVAGVRVLQDGGNAVDAALTAAAVMGVVQPMMSGLGGDTFVVYCDARAGRVRALNGSGPAPAAMTVEKLRDELGHAEMPQRGMLAPSVPGAVDAMVTLLEGWGSGRFDLPAILAPAIRHARDGAPVAPVVSLYWQNGEAVLSQFPSSRAALLLPDGHAPMAGTIFPMPDYARSLELVARGGRDAFYRGEIAQRIVDYARAHGGLFTLEDFASYRCELVEPIATRYRDATIYTNPPPSHGSILLEELNLLEAFDPAFWGFGSATTIHHMVEAKKLAFADRNAYAGDPRFVKDHTATVISKAHAERRRRELDPRRAQTAAPPGSLAELAGETTYLCAADRDGNMVSFITSLSNAFGCGEVVAETGIMLNNRAGRGFRIEPGHPNCVGPGKRTVHTLHAYLVERDSGARLVGGTPGGDGQPQWNFQILANVLDFEMNLQAAIDAPRWESIPGTDPANLDAPFELALESGFDPETIVELEALGHRVTDATGLRGVGGAAQLVERDARGVLTGASDSRVDGCALGC